MQTPFNTFPVRPDRLPAGQAEAAKTGKPMLLLFQEVPGCSNCTHFGNNTLSVGRMDLARAWAEVQ